MAWLGIILTVLGAARGGEPVRVWVEGCSQEVELGTRWLSNEQRIEREEGSSGPGDLPRGAAGWQRKKTSDSRGAGLVQSRQERIDIRVLQTAGRDSTVSRRSSSSTGRVAEWQNGRDSGWVDCGGVLCGSRSKRTAWLGGWGASSRPLASSWTWARARTRLGLPCLPCSCCSWCSSCVMSLSCHRPLHCTNVEYISQSLLILIAHTVFLRFDSGDDGVVCGIGRPPRGCYL